VSKLQKNHLSIFWLAVTVAVSARLLVFFGSMILPIPNELGLPVSPLWANALDIDYYQSARMLYFVDPDFSLASLLQAFSSEKPWSLSMPGPVFPFMLHLFEYGAGNTLWLSSVYLLVSCLLATAWLWWLSQKGLNQISLCIFALLPTPFWFMLNVSTDLLFAAFVCAFWLVWFSGPSAKLPRMPCVAIIIVLAVLLRPNAISLLFYLFVDVLIWEFLLVKQAEKRRRGLLFAGFVLLVTSAFLVFYYGYFQMVMRNGGQIIYFGKTPGQYGDGIFPAFPAFADHLLSWLALLGAKILYLAGLRPSYGDVLTPLIMLRLLPGLIILPGLLWLPFQRNRREQLFLVTFLAPLVLSISQERYLLPVQPILFFYGIKAWGDVSKFMLKAKKSFS
jgi:hypothetical protein